MVRKRKEVSILVFLIFLLVALNYQFLDEKAESFLNSGKTQEVHVERVIDGDTIVYENGSIRLLGINTPERGEFLYAEAKSFLESLVLNQTVLLEFTKDKYDKYNRTLAYVFFEKENVNAKLVENGFANYYFYDGNDIYSNDLIEAWNICIENKVGLCEESTNVCVGCINIESDLILNSCNFSCNITSWEIKGEGREKFIFNETNLDSKETIEFELDIENSGGSLFLRDEKGKLVVWRK